MKTNTTRTNVTTYTAKVPDREITEALCKVLAEHHGFSLGGDGVRFRGYLTSEDTSTGFKHSWNIEVTVDHSQEPRHADEA
jgi:hypothetical protein